MTAGCQVPYRTGTVPVHPGNPNDKTRILQLIDIDGHTIALYDVRYARYVATGCNGPSTNN
jgi:hypothetical protein